MNDRTSQTWTYEWFANGQLKKVTDPVFNYVASLTYSTQKINNLWRTTFTDRRSKIWKFYFDDDGNRREVHTPLSEVWTYTFDTDHNVLTTVNPLSKTWTMTWGPVGNLLTQATPIFNQTWTLAWLAPGVGEPDNFYRLLQVTDPANHWVKYFYADGLDPTLVTKVTEMADGQGGLETDTTIEYYGATPASSRGKLKKVTDGNAVEHRYSYDGWGYFSGLEEGMPLGAQTVFPFVHTQTNDEAGRPITAGGDNPGGSAGYDDEGNLDSLTCEIMLSHKPMRLGNPPAPYIAALTNCLNSAVYDGLNRLTSWEGCIDTDYHGNTRSRTTAYDAVGRTTSVTLSSDEHLRWPPPNVQFDRTTDYTLHDAQGRVLTRTGPDGKETTYTYDDLGRAKTITRGTTNPTSVVYYYDAAGRMTDVDYGNGTSVQRSYDDGNRLLWIKHKNGLGQVLFQLDYVWNINNTPASRVETDNVNTRAATVNFGYDDRDRLISEVRVSSPPQGSDYSWYYEYDGLGNRTSKRDAVMNPEWVTTYFYDSDPSEREPGFPTNNNRLMRYVISQHSVLKREVKYVYYKNGNVSNITIEDQSDPGLMHDLALTYTRSGMLWLAVWGTYDDVNPYLATAAREFRGDSYRARYMDRAVDPNDDFKPIGAMGWTDYDGDVPYGDFDVTVNINGQDADIDEQTRYLAGFGVHAQQAATGGAEQYLHGDLIRSTNLTTDENGAAANTLAYSAFGEAIGTVASGSPRYQYAGGWGYESDMISLQGDDTSLPAITLQHVGARWYQPDSGRFIQRDPIGIVGGLNVYAYVNSEPLSQVDPDGLWSLWPNTGRIRYGPSRVGWGPTGKGVYKLAFRVGPKVHIFGLRGAACFAGPILGAAAFGATLGTVANAGTKAVTGRSLSERGGRLIYDVFVGPKYPGYDPDPN